MGQFFWNLLAKMWSNTSQFDLTLKVEIQIKIWKKMAETISMPNLVALGLTASSSSSTHRLLFVLVIYYHGKFLQIYIFPLRTERYDLKKHQAFKFL